MSQTVREPLRDIIGRVLYEEADENGDPVESRDWYQLNEERREFWRKDGDRVLAAIQMQELQHELEALRAFKAKVEETVLRHIPPAGSDAQ